MKYILFYPIKKVPINSIIVSIPNINNPIILNFSKFIISIDTS